MRLKIPLAVYVRLYAWTAFKLTFFLLIAAGMSVLIMTVFLTGPHETVTGSVTGAGMRTGNKYSLTTTVLYVKLSSGRRVQTTLPSSLPIRINESVELEVYERMVIGSKVYAFVRYLEPVNNS